MPVPPIPSMLQPISRPLMPGCLRDDPRHELERFVAVQFRDLERRVSARSVNISVRGMFIRSRESRPAGSKLDFELSLARAEPLVCGEGEIIWMRRFELGAHLPAGMGIRFLELDAESRRMLQSFITARANGGDPSADPGDDLLGSAAAPTATRFVNPLSGLSGSEQNRLYSFAGCASAAPEWNHRLRRFFTRGVRAARNAIRG